MIEKLHEASLKSEHAYRRLRRHRLVVPGLVTVAMMAGLLAGPVAAPDRSPGRPRHGCYLWHVFTDWLGYRRQVRRGSGATSERRRNKAR